MRKVIFSLLFFIFLSNFAFAQELSDYPDFFIKDDSLDVVIVVGDKAPATHVLAQTQIALSLSRLVSERAEGLSKLDSEVEAIYDINVISIGNACINEVTAEILDYPEPCDEFLEENAAIELFENDESVHVVINAVTDEGIKKAAEVLANYWDYDLEDDYFEIEVEEEYLDMEVEDEGGVDEAEDDVIYGENDELDEIPPVVKGQNVEPKLIDADFHEDFEEDEEVTLDDTEDEEESGNFITGFLKWIMSWFG